MSIEIYKKIRKKWTRNPIEQVVKSKKKYSRKKAKEELRKEIENGE